MNLEITYATRADADKIAVLSRQTFYDTFAPVNTRENMDKFMASSFSLPVLAAEVGIPENTFIAAYLEGELVGYAKIAQTGNPPELGNANAIEISRIYAAQKAVGLGVGKALMEKCIQVALAENKSLIWLGVWEHNQRAIAFYTKFGFEKFGTHDFVLGDDVQTDWLMKKTIGP